MDARRFASLCVTVGWVGAAVQRGGESVWLCAERPGALWPGVCVGIVCAARFVRRVVCAATALAKVVCFSARHARVIGWPRAGAVVCADGCLSSWVEQCAWDVRL